MRPLLALGAAAVCAAAAPVTFVPVTSSSVRWVGRRLPMAAQVPPRAIDGGAAGAINGTTVYAVDWEGSEAEVACAGCSVIAAVVLDSSGGNSRFASYLSTINTTGAVSVGASDPDPSAGAIPGLRTGLHTTSALQTVYVLASGPSLTALPGGVRVRLQLLTEPSFIDSGCGFNTDAGPLQIAGFLLDGALLPPRALSKRRIEFLGDSLTAGYGAGFDDPVTPPVAGGQAPSPAPLQPCGGNTAINDVSTTYGSRLCTAFGADCSWVAVSGVCIMAHSGSNLPDYWNVTLGSMLQRSKWARDLTPWSQCNEALGGGVASVPQAVVVNLGENDMHAAPKPPTPAWLAQLAASYVEFVGALWRAYAACSGASDKSTPVFFLTIGPHEAGQSAAIVAALPQLVAAGYKALLLNATVPLPPALPAGCGGHPGPSLHAAAAQRAAPVVSEALGWDYTGL